MHVVATAGHVDHGKSTLVRTLTGMDPDRWAEERRRGMTIDLGFAWTTLRSGRRLALVDVPGHERFVPNMLAGVGPVPAAMMVVAADEGWMPQSGEHLAALHALDVRHGLLVVTRSDLADAELLEAATAEAQAALEGTSLAGIATVAVSGTTGAGLDELRRALDSVLAQLPEPDVDAPVRLWVDRCFTVTGSGSVVTGTLAAGRVRVGDELVIASSGQRVTVRGLQSLGETVTDVPAVARVALNLRGVARSTLRRGEALLTPGNFVTTDTVDVRLHGDSAAELPRTLVLHAGSAAVPVRVRPLGDDTARLSLARALPLRLGDRALLRDAGRHHVAGGLTMLDVRPPRLQRRGSATARAAVLATVAGNPDEVSEVRRRRLVRRADLAAMGVPVSREPIARDWLADPAYWAELRQRLDELVARHKEQHPLEDGPPVEAVRQRLGLPDVALVEALVAASQNDDLAGPGRTAAPPPLALRGGRIVRAGAAVGLPPAVQAAMERLREDLAAAPFAAPDAARLVEFGLGPREVAAAARAGALLRVTDTVVLLPGAAEVAAGILRDLEQPFTLSEARRALATTRRVAVPLLEFLDRQGWTRRLPDDRRTMR